MVLAHIMQPDSPLIQYGGSVREAHGSCVEENCHGKSNVSDHGGIRDGYQSLRTIILLDDSAFMPI